MRHVDFEGLGEFGAGVGAQGHAQGQTRASPNLVARRGQGDDLGAVGAKFHTRIDLDLFHDGWGKWVG